MLAAPGYRVARQTVATIPQEVTNPKSESDALSWSEVRSALDDELQQLPEKYRAPLVLCCLSGKTRDEAAEELGWTLNVLKGRLERVQRYNVVKIFFKTLDGQFTKMQKAYGAPIKAEDAAPIAEYLAKNYGKK